MSTAVLVWPTSTAPEKGHPMRWADVMTDARVLGGGLTGVGAAVGLAWRYVTGEERRRRRAEAVAAQLVEAQTTDVLAQAAERLVGPLSRRLEDAEGLIARQGDQLAELHKRAAADAVQMQGLESEVHVLRKDRVSDRAVFEALRAWALGVVAVAERNAAHLIRLGGKPEPMPPMPPQITTEENR